MTDEAYAQFRYAGWWNGGPGAKVEDLTPKFPAELLPIIKYVQEQINTLGNFPEVMQGKGESGVRAGAHADTLIEDCFFGASRFIAATGKPVRGGGRSHHDDDGSQGGSQVLDRSGEDGRLVVHADRSAGGLAGHGRQPLVESDLPGRGDAVVVRAAQGWRCRRRVRHRSHRGARQGNRQGVVARAQEVRPDDAGEVVGSSYRPKARTRRSRRCWAVTASTS